MFSLITATGMDARNFLQGQLTQDMDRVTANCSPLAAWCTPRGRVIATLRLLAHDEGVGVVLPSEMVDPVLAGLARYRLRAKVDLAPAGTDWTAVAVANAQDFELLKARHLMPEAAPDASRSLEGVHTVRPSQEQDFIEIYARRTALEALDLAFAKPLHATGWRQCRIAAGIADIVPATTDKYTPHMLNLDLLGAISFEKGCYTGQEIVARTEHLGSVKRRLKRFSASSALAVGDGVLLDGTTVGNVVAAADRDVLVMLPVALHEQKLHAAGAQLHPH